MSLNAPTILVVDDDDAIRGLLRLVLEDEGYEVVEAENGAVGLEAASHHHPDLIVLDLAMPVMDGRTFFERIRASHCRGVPVIVVSALTEGREVGADAALGKPFDPGVLVAEVARLL